MGRTSSILIAIISFLYIIANLFPESDLFYSPSITFLGGMNTFVFMLILIIALIDFKTSGKGYRRLAD